MRPLLRTLLAAIALLAACQPLSTPTPASPPPLALTWPASGEAVAADPLLQWESFPGATHYQVTLRDGRAAVILEQDTPHPLFRVTPPLPKGQSYAWNVQAQDADHTVLAELNSQFSVKDDLGLVWPPDRAVVDALPVLQWQGFAGAAQYRVWIALDQAEPPQVVVDEAVAGTAYAIASALAPGDYQWRVQAQDAGQGVLAELSSRFSVKAALALLEPGDGAEVSATPLFRWGPFEGATHYQVTVVEADTYPPVVALDILSQSTQWLVVDPPFKPDTSYTLVIRALDHGRRLLAESDSTFRVYATHPFYDCDSARGLPAAECQALVALYEATGGVGWSNSANWLSTDVPCEWAGVACTDGHVTQLYLYRNALAGSLPSDLGDLTYLRVLALSENQLAGAIPPELARLAHLASLDLSRNTLSGSLPPELAELGALEFMLLHHNQLGGPLPTAWDQFPALRHLDLSHNAFTGAIPGEWGQNHTLESLRLGYNQLGGAIPDSVGALEALTELDVQYNQLTGAVPPTVLALPQRALWGNQLNGTTRCDSATPTTVDVAGIRLSCTASLGASLWPEVLPAIPPDLGAPFWAARPAHLRLTLAGTPGAAPHMPLGASLSDQAQVLVFPLDELLDLDRTIRLEYGELLALLDDRPGDIEGDMPLLPLDNAGQVLHARVRYLSFANGSGVRYLVQPAMGPAPINNQALFYTFQGVTDDRAYYVAAFFPVSHPSLPATAQLSDEAFAELTADYAGYLATTMALLEDQSPASFTPSLAEIDRLVESLTIHGDQP